HFVISIFFETIYQFETKDTLLECFKNITTTGHFGVIGAQYEKIDATRWIGDYEEVNGFEYIDKAPSIYFSVGDDFNPEELIIPINLAYHYFNIAISDFLIAHPEYQKKCKEIQKTYSQ
ncbi:TPA: hypothetical protein ACJKH5_002094, partial [Neisseria meningitidis]